MENSISALPAADLNVLLERWIEQRTGGRVHCLRVELTGGQVVIHGYTGSYHVRQLALAAVLDALDALPSAGTRHAVQQTLRREQVELRIEVGIV